MSVVIVTGSAGLIGSEAARFFHEKGYDIIGMDNDMRAHFFGPGASTAWNRRRLERELPRYTHQPLDIRDFEAVEAVFERYQHNVALVIHAAAQPSHEWAAREPLTDFTVNANGTLNLLEATRRHSPQAVFIYTSTNKVYGDLPNALPFVEKPQRWEVDSSHPMALHGIDESLSIDQSKHGLFGASKTAADVLVQEYARYFGMTTVAFRGGCLTGPAHAGTELHGFLAYLVLCAVKGIPYMIFGYKGKQVRDNIHSRDLIEAFWHYFQDPKPGAVYNIGGSRHSNVSVLEAIEMIADLGGGQLKFQVSHEARNGDHIWYISDVRRFRRDYPRWEYNYTLERTIKEMIDAARRGPQ